MAERKRSESRQRQKLLGVRVTDAELAALTAGAKREGKPLARFLRDAGLNAAKEPSGA